MAIGGNLRQSHGAQITNKMRRGAMDKGPDRNDAFKLALATLFYIVIVLLAVWRLWE